MTRGTNPGSIQARTRILQLVSEKRNPKEIVNVLKEEKYKSNKGGPYTLAGVLYHMREGAGQMRKKTRRDLTKRAPRQAHAATRYRRSESSAVVSAVRSILDSDTVDDKRKLQIIQKLVNV
jgi:hypothetical protein